MASTALPSAIKYGYVAGRFGLAVGDSNDADDKPDFVASYFEVTFTPMEPVIKTIDDDGNPTTITRQPIKCQLDADGFLVYAVPDTQPPEFQKPVALTTGNYKVKYSAPSELGTHPITVTDQYGKTAPLWLTDAEPAGEPLTPSQYAELTARIDGIEADTTSAAESAAAAATSEANAAQSAQAAADSMGGVTVTGTPDAGSLLVGVSGTEAKWQAPGQSLGIVMQRNALPNPRPASKNGWAGPSLEVGPAPWDSSIQAASCGATGSGTPYIFTPYSPDSYKVGDMIEWCATFLVPQGLVAQARLRSSSGNQYFNGGRFYADPSDGEVVTYAGTTEITKDVPAGTLCISLVFGNGVTEKGTRAYMCRARIGGHEFFDGDTPDDEPGRPGSLIYRWTGEPYVTATVSVAMSPVLAFPN